MLKHLKFRQLLYALIVTCLLVRFIFIMAVQQIPVMWDARIYSSAALGLIHFIKDPDRFGHPEIDSPADSAFYRAQFEYEMNDLIQGEQINWLYYKIPTATEAQDYLFLSGPVYPAFLAALFYISPAGDFMLVRILNVLLDAISLLLLILIACRLFGERTAILAGLLYIFYLPFILLTGVVSPEPLTKLMILLTTYLILLWYDHQKSKYLIYSGAMLGLLALLKPTAVLLFIPFGAAVIFDFRKQIGKIVPPLIKAAVPFIIIIIPWIIITSLYYGKLSIRDPDYSAANIRSSSSIEYEGYDLDYTDKDFWVSPVMNTIAEQPIGYAGLMVKKFIRLWGQPFNDFRQAFVIGPRLSLLYHFLIIITGLFGVFVFLADSKKGLILLFLLPFYYTGIHVIFHALARYNLNAMPFVIVASAAVMLKIYDYFKEKLSVNRISTAAKMVLILAGLAAVLLLPGGLAVSLIGKSGAAVTATAKVIILVALLYFVYKELRPVIGKNVGAIMAFPAILLVIVTLVPALSADSWAEWKCRLNSPNGQAGVRIYIPDGFRLGPGEPARIGIDMTREDGRGLKGNVFGLSINGQRTVLDPSRPPFSDFYYRKMTYNVFQNILGVDSMQMPAWRFIPLNPEIFNQLLDQYGYIDIVVDNGGSGSLELRGGYNIGRTATFRMPSLTHSSIERYIQKGDPRIWTDYNLSSDSAISYYIENSRNRQVEYEDLSGSFGRQAGRYRIILEIKRLNEARYYF
ncbi:MAG: hypothetical protein CVT49_11355 [candidate division Zixibacteria bacterium HGW-Zixibacteria-1]|nr:MAG: hypothetical protein CVT49_11355 [candidate division Zixibacteria bacterium HGW-Zixibacteria-1]